MFRISPPGFPKPLWRGWEGGAGSIADAGVRSDLTVAVTTIERSLGGCHREEVRRDPTDCPGSNQHHYVRQQPHRCENIPVTARRKESEEFLKSESTRVQLAMNFVARCNAFSRQKSAGYKPAPSVPRVIGQSCLMCVTRGTCLGSACLGNNVLHNVRSRREVKMVCSNDRNGNIPGCQAKFVKGGIENEKQGSKVNRDICLKPQHSLFNWPVWKDPPGTVKHNLLKIVVTPPSTSSRPSVQKKKRPRPIKTRRRVNPPPKLILHPDFWSQPQNDPIWTRKQRFTLSCRKDAECQEKFSSIRDREVHEGLCLSFDQFSRYCIDSLGLNGKVDDGHGFSFNQLSRYCINSLGANRGNCSQNVKLKGGANTIIKVKSFAAEDDTLLLLNILRPLQIFKLFSDHQKCKLVNKNTRKSICKFCMLRSLMLKINQEKGRRQIIPDEFLAAFEDLDSESVIEDIETIIGQIDSIITGFKENFCVKWNCNDCQDEDVIIDLSCDDDSNQDISFLVNNFEQQVYQEHGKHDGTILKLSEKCTVLSFYSATKMSVKFSKLLSFGGKRWRIKSLVTTKDCCFRTKGGYVNASDTSSFINNNDKIENVELAIYESLIEDLDCNEDLFIYSGRNDYEIIKKCTPERRTRKDRHKPSAMRRLDRHKPSAVRRLDRHKPSAVRRLDRHKPSALRRLDRHKPSAIEIQILADLQSDTGMELCCSICFQLKSYKSCVLSSNLPAKHLFKYVVDNEVTRSINGKLYVCSVCKISIQKGEEPVRSEKELLGFLDFPQTLKSKLRHVCAPLRSSNVNQSPENFTKLNKLEDFLLKLVIPFIRIGHLPPGSYFRVRGGLVMISSNIQQTINKILPIDQSLIPVSFKRKLEYSGYFIEEYIDKNKVITTFQWLKKYNHLYEHYEIDEALIEEFESRALKVVKDNEDEKMDEEEEHYDDDLAFEHPTIITDKYRENMSGDTVTNRLAKMVIQLEDHFKYNPSECLVLDPEDEFYPEDDVDKIDDESPVQTIKTSDLHTEIIENLSNEDLQIYDKYCKGVIEFESRSKPSCKCSYLKETAFAIRLVDEFKKLNPSDGSFVLCLENYLEQLQNLIQKSRKYLETLKDCDHKDNEVGFLFDEILRKQNQDPADVSLFVKSQTKIIKQNLQKVYVAPGESGVWKNWEEDVYLEEKLFPQLFPFGIGGYLSSCLLKNNNMGFANYCKSRLLSANNKFRKDPFYIFFLLLVKEMIEMRRSEQTFFRKASKVQDLTASKVGQISKEFLLRNNNIFRSFKSLRGTSMYFEDVKKRLMATIRQNGSPTLFCTFSCAEFHWDHLVKSIYETVNRTKVSIEFIKDQESSWKNKLVSENVVQSTMHFCKRTNKIIGIINKTSPFVHDGVEYFVDNYFIRTEFQQRGSPHNHVMLWLRGRNGEKPPAMFSDSDEDMIVTGQKIAEFGHSFIQGSFDAATCGSHNEFNEACTDCRDIKENVMKFQCHTYSHKPSCLKKKKFMKIAGDEGYGRLDGKIHDFELIVPICRYGFPKNPSNETVFLHAFAPDHTSEKVNVAKEDYKKIRKFLLRLTHGSGFQESLRWKEFLSMDFYQFLFEVGMFGKFEKLPENDDQREAAKAKYFTALRCEVKTTGILLLKRSTKDVFTNNFNCGLLKIHPANIDVQYILDEYKVAQYISDYCTKNEGGLSKLLKNINDNAVEHGESSKETMKKLVKALDKGREVSIQEAIYRLLGLPMTSFSTVVKFINTNHPDRREGLLKGNLEHLNNEESIFHSSLHDYYQDRPLTTDEGDTDWNNMSLAEFVSEYDIVYKSGTRKNVVQLRNNRGYIAKRGKPCVIRYFLHYESKQEHYRGLCLLFHPFRNEHQDIHKNDVESLYFQNEDQIEFVRQRFESHRKIVDSIKNIEEKLQQKLLDDDDDDDDENQFLEDETTSLKEIKEFEDQFKAQAKRYLALNNVGSERMENDKYIDMINSLNGQQQKIFNDFCERLETYVEDDPFYLYIAGEAGTGKSFLLRLMIEFVKRLPKQSGQEINKPVYITVAPTGVAAYLVHGSTIESALSLISDRKTKYTNNSDGRNADLRFLYEDLKVIFLDEVSMLGTNLFTKMNFRLQEIMGNSLFMGGVSIVTTGDFGQLPPVKDRMIWESSHLDARPDIAPMYWNDHFSIYYLSQKMRSQDNEFSVICDQVRKGICNSQVQSYMKQHVKKCPNENDHEMYKSGKLCIIVTTNEDRERINHEKLHSLLPDKKSYFVSSSDEATNSRNPPPLPDKLPMSKTGQLESQIVFKEGAPVMITTNHDNKKYKNNGIVNGSRGYIDSIQTTTENPDVAEIIWVRFNDDKTGQLLREDNKVLLRNHKPNDPLAVPIKKRKKSFSLTGNISWVREQYPLTLCYAITAHKSQGQTLDEVIIDFSSPKTKIFLGSFYVALTRVRNGSSFYLRDFKPEYIQANPDVEKKLLSMKTFNSYKFKKIYLDNDIFDGDNSADKELKVGYINTNDLSTSSSDVFINTNENLVNLDLLCVADTRLTGTKSKEDVERNLCNWSILRRFDSYDGDDHMGLLLLQSKHSKFDITDKQIVQKEGIKRIDGKEKVYIQTMKVLVKTCDLLIGFVYIRATPNQEELDKLMKSFQKCDLIMGDLNLDPAKTNGDQESKLRQLCGTSRAQVLKEFTFTNFNQLDHIILRTDLAKKSYSTSYRNPTSDHRTITIRLPVNSHALSENFKMAMNYDQGLWTRMMKKPYSDDTDQKIRFTKEIVNTYIELLRKVKSKALIFYTNFIQDLLEHGYGHLDSSYKVSSIIEASSVTVPFDFRDEKNASFKGLLIWTKENLAFYDPQSIDQQPQKIEENRKLAHWFLKDFIVNLYSSFDLPPPRITIDCFDVEGSKISEDLQWIFILSVAKYHVFGLEFNFENCSLPKQHEIMSREIKSMKIFPLKNNVEKISIKRQTSDPEEKIEPSRKRRKPGSKQHIFSNVDQESCWMNSCLQTMFAVLDHSDDLNYFGTTLFELLLWYKGMDTNTPINPLEIKELLYTRERQRIIERNVSPQFRLFHYANTTTIDPDELDLQINQRGQQDCKDFFICLEENKDYWQDVYTLFKFSYLNYTVCSNCNQTSRPESSSQNEHIIFHVSCPSNPLKLSSLIVQAINEPNLVTEWKHEGGCEQITSGWNYRKIDNLSNLKFLLVIVERLTQLDNGRLHIVDTQITVDGEFSVNDSQGSEVTFKPIAVIHHTGHVNKSSTNTSGHYRSDILDADTDQWFQTSDEDLPLLVATPSDQGYIIVLKKI